MKVAKELYIAGRRVYLYTSKVEAEPLIIINAFTGDGSSWMEEFEKTETPCQLAVIGNLNWDHDMSPWACSPLSAKEAPCTGGADAYIDDLTKEIVPQILANLDKQPTWIGMVGYSLAGLFALYAMYRTDIFSRIASVSGSLWFPNFKNFVETHDILKVPERLYLSLGDKEAKTRHPILKTVEDNTNTIVDYYRQKGISVQYEMNVGNHFKDEDKRIVKGIMALLK